MSGVSESRGTVLVTGASRGIGGAIAKALAARGWEVIGTCRDPRAVAQKDRIPGVRYLALDLLDERSLSALLKKVPAVDALVSNAGASTIGPAEEAPIAEVRELFQLNFFGAVRLTQALLPGMRARGRGAIVFIGSMRGEAPSPFSSFYSATKAALHSFAACLRLEVREYGITVSVVAPWHIRTTLPQVTQVAAQSPYSESVGRVKEARDRMMSEAAAPEVVAQTVAKALAARNARPFYSVGKNAAIQALLSRHLPRGLVEKFSMRRFGLS
jgi:short-subunit dehydrogenase